MNDLCKSSTFNYKGGLRNACEGFIKEKRALGYKYDTEARALSVFTDFAMSFELPENTITKEVVQAWIAKKPMDSDRSRYGRFSLISQFTRYMVRVGYVAYVPKRDEIGKQYRKYTPYIFSHEEIQAFFTAADSMTCSPKSGAPRRHLIMPLMFRMLYCCGLRVSEAANLLSKDVDLDTGILTIRESKFGKSRYVPMSAELTTVCAGYAMTRLVGKSDADWFFAAPDGGHYSTKAIYSVFRELLWQARISHGGRGKGPRLHDFRHTFCVHCLQRWVAQGADPATVLPRLSAYVGHNDFGATEHYLRMTAEAYPEISRLMQEKYSYVIPGSEATVI